MNLSKVFDSNTIGITITLLAFIAGWASSAGISVKAEKIPLLKDNESRLVIFLAASIIGILLIPYQITLKQIEDSTAIKKEHQRFDSSIAIVVRNIKLSSDSSTRTIVNRIDTNLHPFGLGLNNSLDIIKYAGNNIATPLLDVSRMHAAGHDGLLAISITFHAYEASCANVNLTVKFVISDSLGHYRMITNTQFDPVISIPVPSPITTNWTTAWLHTDKLVFTHIYGTYQNVSQTKTYIIDRFLVTTINTESLQYPLPYEIDEVKKIIERFEREKANPLSGRYLNK